VFKILLFISILFVHQALYKGNIRAITFTVIQFVKISWIFYSHHVFLYLIFPTIHFSMVRLDSVQVQKSLVNSH